MTIEQAIITRLESLTPVSTFVGQRVYAKILPHTPTLPAIRVQAIATAQQDHLRGLNALQRSLVQVDVVTDQDEALAEQLELVHGPGDGTALAGWKGVVGPAPGGIAITGILAHNKREDYDAAELRQFKVMRDYEVWWRRRRSA
jgi:hypothetical protein